MSGLCVCGHVRNIHAGADAAGRCVKRSCDCGYYEDTEPETVGTQGNEPEPLVRKAFMPEW